MTAPVRIARLAAEVFRVPIDRPVETSFGVMRDRPAVFVRLEDTDGAFGWGEVFANWPAAGAEHRARLVMEDIADLLLGREIARPGDLFHVLTAETRIRALQCGEWGPFAQGIAGLDTAAQDLFARRAGTPLHRHLRTDAPGAVPAYASGIKIADAPEAIPAARAAGFTAFKVKVGFDMDADVAGIRAAAAALAPGERLFADANQAWDVRTALDFAGQVAACGLGWLEEPIPADAPDADWARLAGDCPIPLAGGENIAGRAAFARAAEAGHLAVIQPDLAKWGGVTGCLGAMRAAIGAGRLACPHFLGGGVGLAASAHLLAAAGGAGLLEVDVNPNPLRDAFGAPGARMRDGCWQIPDLHGLGIEALPEEILRYRTLSLVRPA